MTNQRPKVVYVVPELSSAGSNHFVHIVPLLRRLSERIDVAVYAERGSDAVQIPGVPNLTVQRRGRGGQAQRIFDTYRYARNMIAQGWDRFFVRISVPAATAILAAARGGRARVYYWSCGLDWREPGPRPLRRRLRETALDRPAFRAVLRNAHRVVTGPERMATYYEQHFGVPRERIALLYNDVDLARFTEVPAPDVAALRDRLGLSARGPVLLFVHHLSRRKGTHLLPEIIRRVLSVHPDATLLVIGDGPGREELARGVQPFGNSVRLLGKVSNRDLDPYWALADLYLMPSEEEGFPRVILEAMAAGLPCVATDVGGVLDVLPAGATRWVVPASDAPRFADAVLDALGDPQGRDRVARQGIERVRCFSTERVAEMFVSAICEGP